MEQPTIAKLSAPKGELIQILQSSKPIIASSYELRPGLIAMVRDQAFSGLDYENPISSPKGVWAALCLPDYLRHDIRNVAVEIVSFLS